MTAVLRRTSWVCPKKNGAVLQKAPFSKEKTHQVWCTLAVLLPKKCPLQPQIHYLHRFWALHVSVVRGLSSASLVWMMKVLSLPGETWIWNQTDVLPTNLSPWISDCNDDIPIEKSPFCVNDHQWNHLACPEVMDVRPASGSRKSCHVSWARKKSSPFLGHEPLNGAKSPPKPMRCWQLLVAWEFGPDQISDFRTGWRAEELNSWCPPSPSRNFRLPTQPPWWCPREVPESHHRRSGWPMGHGASIHMFLNAFVGTKAFSLGDQNTIL